MSKQTRNIIAVLLISLTLSLNALAQEPTLETDLVPELGLGRDTTLNSVFNLENLYIKSTPEQYSTPEMTPMFTGYKTSEAIMRFDHWVELKSETKPNFRLAKEQIEKQISYLFGPMAILEPKAVPKTDHKITNIKVLKQSENTYQIFYSFVGTILIQRSRSSNYTIVLPNNPDEVFQSANSNGYNYCTDPHYLLEGDFWYFWNPFEQNCALRERTDFNYVKTKVQRIANIRISYPEYERLADPKTGFTTLSVFFGLENGYNHVPNPFHSRELNSINYREFRKKLTGVGFKSEVISQNEFSKLTNSRIKMYGYVERLSLQNVIIYLFFGPTGIQENSKTFHYFLKYTLENSSVVIYGGHSGLGGNLDLNTIEYYRSFKIKIPKNRYQIYYFNSCSSYPYYNTLFFDRKSSRFDMNGTKNLDILTNGLSVYFQNLKLTSFALVEAVLNWNFNGKKISYQSLAKMIEDDSLFGISGDEDNN